MMKNMLTIEIDIQPKNNEKTDFVQLSIKMSYNLKSRT